MTTIEYLKEKLDVLANKFPKVQIRYAYNTQIETHIIELTPVKEYYNNVVLDDCWIEISLEFSKKFPFENISFISSDSSLSITKSELEWNFKPINQLDLFTKEFYSEFGILETKIHKISFPTTFTYQRIQVENFTFNIQIEPQTINNPEKSGDLQNGNTQYAMAA